MQKEHLKDSMDSKSKENIWSASSTTRKRRMKKKLKLIKKIIVNLYRSVTKMIDHD